MDKSIGFILLRNKCKQLLIVAILLININAFGQIVVYGYVLDSNNNPIINTNVIDLKTKKGAYTNDNGYFSFKTQNSNTTIKISHIGFKSYNYNHVKTVSDSLNIVVYLNQNYSSLAPVDISSEKTHLLYYEPGYYVYDFAFNKSNILLLINHSKYNELLYIDEYNDTLSILNTNKGLGLIKDCLGNIQVISKDSIYQIYIDEDDFIYSVYSYPFDAYLSQLAPCAATIDSAMLFVQHSENKQSEIYYYYDSKHEYHILKQIANEVKNKEATIENLRITIIEEELALKRKRKGSSGEMAEGKSSLAKGRELFQRKAYYKFILTKPVYNPIFRINDSLFLFDHVNNRCYVYDRTLTLSRIFNISYCDDNNWAKELFVDEVENKIYAKFEKNGIISLKELSLNNGRILKEYILNDCIFPLKIGVNNGYAYFLKNEVYGSYNTKLYKQQLK